MRKRMSWMLTLVLVLGTALSCAATGAMAYDEEITFAGIPWLSGMETAEEILAEQGLIGEEGKQTIELEISRQKFALRRLQRGWRSETSYEAFVPAGAGRYTVSSAEKGSLILQIHLMSSDVISDWMGHEVHHITLLYTFDGVETRLVNVNVSLMVSRKDVTEQLKEKYGSPDYTDREEESSFWKGSGDTGLYYNTSEFNYGLLNAVELIDSTTLSVELTPTPEPTVTPEPTPEPTPTPEPVYLPTAAPGNEAKDMLEILEAGNIQFPGIPWGTDLEGALSQLTIRGIFDASRAVNYFYNVSDSALYLYEREGGIFTKFSKSPRIQAYSVWSYIHNIRMTFGGFPIDSMEIACDRDSGCFNIQFTLSKMRGGDTALTKLAESLEAFYGPGKCVGNVWTWKDDAGNAMQVYRNNTWCYIVMSRLTDPDTF